MRGVGGGGGGHRFKQERKKLPLKANEMLIFIRRTFVYFLIFCHYFPTTYQVYGRDGSAWTVMRAATLPHELQIKLGIQPSNSILTPGQAVPELILQGQASGRVATDTGMTRPGKVGFNSRITRSGC